MTVKHGLLAILTLGPAYGLQLRDELITRAPHRDGINVGQVYGTLERLRSSELITESDVTDDGLQLYELTAQGRDHISMWLRRPAQATTLDWAEMLDQVLVVSSLPDSSIGELIRRYHEVLDSLDVGEPPAGHQRYAAARATTRQLHAAREWLSEISGPLQLPSASAELSALRPRRGRRASAPMS